MDFNSENVFLTIKSLHIVAVICWMVGLLYLPRLLAYHSLASSGSESDQTFQIMEKKLLRLIINPAMVATILLGLLLAHFIGFGYLWLHLKLALVLALAAFHGFLAKCVKNFALGKNKHSNKFYRLINEIPTICLFLIVFLVIFKPFQ